MNVASERRVIEKNGSRTGNWFEPARTTCSRMGATPFEFLRSQRIGRLATVGPSGWPHVVPVVYAFDEAGTFEFDVDGVKLRNLKSEPRAAMVIDSMGPKRGVAVQGRVDLIGPERARLSVERKFTWGL